MIKIGSASYKTHRPADLDARLVEATGCNAAEIVQVLGGEPLASTVAAALLPFLVEDVPALPVLAGEIAAAGPDALVAVRKLYASVPDVEPAS